MTFNFSLATISGSAPGTSGTTFTVSPVGGSQFAAGKATVIKASVTGFPDPSTAEVVTLPAPSGNVFTGVARASEGPGAAINLAVGDYLLQGITAASWDAVVAAIAALPGTYGRKLVATSKTTTYTAAAGDLVLANATSAGFTVSLPASPAAGDAVAVKKTDTSANVVTVVGSGGTTIDGDPNATIVSHNAGGIFTFDGSGWQVTAVSAASASSGIGGSSVSKGFVVGMALALG